MHAESDSDVIQQAEASTAGAFFRDERTRGVVRIVGGDALDLLNRLTTAKLDDLVPGQVRETLVTTEKGRVMDAVLVLPGESAVLLLTSGETAETLIAWLDKYTIMEDCRYTDAGAEHTQFSVYKVPEGGIDGIPLPEEGAAGEHRIADAPVRVLRHDSVTGAGLRLLCDAADAEKLAVFLSEDCGLPRLGDHAFALWRVDALVPAVGHELSEHANPLESGSAASVDFEKGCYIGQEVIARLDSYDKVQRKPCRITWPDGAPENLLPATTLTAERRNAGFVTTHAYDPRSGMYRGIGLIRNAFADAGTGLTCEAEGTEYRVLVGE